MRLVRGDLNGEQLAHILSIYDLMPDELAANPGLIGAVAASSQFFWMQSGRRMLGLVWLSNIVLGASVDMHVLLNKKHRRFMRPEKLSKAPARDINSAGKMAAFDWLADYCFGKLGCRRITAPVPVSRKAAVRLVRRLGFSREGRIRQGVAFGGKPEDVWIFGLTKEDHHGMGTGSS